MELSYEQRTLLRRVEVQIDLLFFWLVGPQFKKGAAAPPPDVTYEAERLAAIEAERAARTILPGSPIVEQYTKDEDSFTFAHGTDVPDNPYEHRPLAWRVGEGESARWIELADFAAGRPLVEATADIETQARASDLDAWEDATWLACNPQARNAEPMTELHPVTIEVPIPANDEDAEQWNEAGHGFRFVEVEVFTETGSSPWDVTQWDIDHAPSDGLDARSTLLSSECVTVTEKIAMTIPDDEGLAVDVEYDVPVRQHRVAVQGCYAELRKARLEARRALDTTLVAQIAAKNRQRLVDTLVEFGFDPKHPDTVRWVEDFKRKARGRDGLAYARALDDLKRRHDVDGEAHVDANFATA